MFRILQRKGGILNMYADDVAIYTSAATSDELQMKFQLCVDNVHQWYKKKSTVMVFASFQ